MKPEKYISRYNLLWIIIFCYFSPLISLIAYGNFSSNASLDWTFLSFGFFLTACGSLGFFWLMTLWEKTLNASTHDLVKKKHQDPDKPIYENSSVSFEDYDITKRSLEEAQQTQIRLLEEIDTIAGELHQKSIFTAKLVEELEHTKQTTKQHLEKQQIHIRELQEVIADQKSISEKKQQQMQHLETKVGDLTGEIKTLLRFAEADNSSQDSTIQNTPAWPANSEVTLIEKEIFDSENPTLTSVEASQQLNLCLDIAQKMKGSQRFGSQIYSFLDSPADSFSLDLRRLCDRLRSEIQSVVLLYSPNDDQLLFASNPIKNLVGWSPDKFIQNFNEILIEISVWKKGINSLAMHSEAQIQLQLKTKTGLPFSLNAVLGLIPTGIFKNHVIAVLYSTTPLPASTFQN